MRVETAVASDVHIANRAAVDALQAHAGDAKVGVPELALDDEQRNALVRHLDRMGMPALAARSGA